MASGVLVVCLGFATRLIPYLEAEQSRNAKEYEGEVRFGFETETDDALGTPRGVELSGEVPASAAWGRTSVAPPDLERRIAAALPAFLGDVLQTPPQYSAKKIQGTAAHRLARRGVRAAMHPTPIRIDEIRPLGVSFDTAGTTRFRFRMTCSRGTYVRAFARDLGRAVACPAHLSGLRRLRSGSFGLAGAVALANLDREALLTGLVPAGDLLPAWPVVSLSREEHRAVMQGSSLVAPPGLPEGALVRLVEGAAGIVDEGGRTVPPPSRGSGRLRGLGRLKAGRIHPFRVRPSA
jgi:tRNA pseudouridine55 synthase